MDLVDLQKSMINARGTYKEITLLDQSQRDRLRDDLEDKRLMRQAESRAGQRGSGHYAQTGVRIQGEYHDDMRESARALQHIRATTRKPSKKLKRLVESEMGGMKRKDRPRIRTGAMEPGTLGVTYPGLKRGSRSTMVVPEEAVGHPDARTTIRHELAHARTRPGATRVLQRHEDPARRGREEARAEWEGTKGQRRLLRRPGYMQIALGSSLDPKDRSALHKITRHTGLGDYDEGAWKKLGRRARRKSISDVVGSKPGQYGDYEDRRQGQAFMDQIASFRRKTAQGVMRMIR